MLLSIIFATMFLTMDYLYPTFASPILSEGSIYVGESLNPRLAMAMARYIPDNQRCLEPSQWVSRQCFPDDGSDRLWVDLCRSNPGVDDFYVEAAMCSAHKMCQNTKIQNDDDPKPVDTIVCIPRPTGNNLLVPGVQTGVYVVDNSSNPQHTVSVRLETNLPGATVAALMEGTY
jgi:hypothetical protein